MAASPRLEKKLLFSKELNKCLHFRPKGQNQILLESYFSSTDGEKTTLNSQFFKNKLKSNNKPYTGKNSYAKTRKCKLKRADFSGDLVFC